MTGAIGAGRPHPAFSFSNPKHKPNGNTQAIVLHSKYSLRPLSHAEHQPGLNYLTGLH
jgi:hypothetical protein